VLKESQWASLVRSLQLRQCVLLLGDEVSRSQGHALKGILADTLAAEAGLPAGAPLATAARAYLQREDRNALEVQVEQFYRARENDPSPLHDDLAALPFPLVLTSCHDRALDNALERAGKPPRTAHYCYRGEKRDLLEGGSPEQPLVYGLYGSIVEGASLVLTEQDLLDFLVAVVSDNPPIPSRIRSELKDPARTFLFLGFGIKHWYLRILLHVLRLHQTDNHNRSFALEDLTPAPPDLEQTVLFYRSGYRIEVVPGDLPTFVKELRGRWDAAGGAAAPRPASPAGIVNLGRRPRVFICHASEDKAPAQRLYDGLQGQGLDPWLDTRKLEVGDQWDPTIEQEIKSADYFVPLLSYQLSGKLFGYVNKEIKRALERQEYARLGIKFILPVRLDDSPLPEELEAVQAEAVSLEAEGIGRLASIIKKDFQVRNRNGVKA